MRSRLSPLAALVLITPSPGLAGGPGIDQDGDGRYSLDELRQEYPTLSEEGFSALDSNRDGLVSPEEFRKGLDLDLLPKIQGN